MNYYNYYLIEIIFINILIILLNNIFFNFNHFKLL